MNDIWNELEWSMNFQFTWDSSNLQDCLDIWFQGTFKFNDIPLFMIWKARNYCNFQNISPSVNLVPNRVISSIFTD